MKSIAILFGLSLAAASLSWRPVSSVSASAAAPVSGPFSATELQQFRAVAPVDVHAHVFVADPSFIAMLQKLDLHILDILVVNDMESGHGDLEKQRREARAVVHASHGYAVLCTSFDPYALNQADYATNAIRGLNDDFARGAIAVKLWKNVGMEIKDASGHYVMPDNPIFEPIFQDIAAHNKTLVAHVADPDSAWQPPNPASPDYEYYRDHPRSYMYGKADVPTKAGDPGRARSRA